MKTLYAQARLGRLRAPRGVLQDRVHLCAINAGKPREELVDRGTAFQIAVLVLPTTSWPRLQRMLGEIAAAVDSLGQVKYRELHEPPRAG